MAKKTAFSTETKEEKLQKLLAQRPKGVTPIPKVEIEYSFSGEKQVETFEYMEDLKWVMSYQNPGTIRDINVKLKGKVTIEGSGAEIQIKY